MLIRTRLIVMITPVVVLLLILLTIYAQLNARDEAWKTANAEALAIAEERSSEVQMQMLLARGYAKSLAANGQYFLDSGQASREEVKGLVKEVLHSEPSILGVGLFFEDYDGKNAEYKGTAEGNSKGQLAPYWSEKIIISSFFILSRPPSYYCSQFIHLAFKDDSLYQHAFFKLG